MTDPRIESFLSSLTRKDTRILILVLVLNKSFFGTPILLIFQTRFHYNRVGHVVL